MTPEEVEQLFATLKYHGDDRRAPDEARRARFRTGWEDATERTEIYSELTLRRLTWQNLGYRFGKHRGSAAVEQIDSVYETLATLWERVWGSVLKKKAPLSLPPSNTRARSSSSRT